MPIHHYIEQYFQQFPKKRIQGVEVELIPVEKRPKGTIVKDDTISLENPTRNIPIRIYTPDDENGKSPLIVFFHGGGQIDGNLEGYDVCCRLLASLSGFKIVAINYTINESQSISMATNYYYDALKWIFNNSEQFNTSPSEIVIAGASIGGFIATSIAIKSTQTNDFHFAKQILYYPIIDLNQNITDSEFQSRALYNGKYGLDISSEKLPSLFKKPSDQKMSPFNIGNNQLEKLPKTLIFTAEYDPLCDEGELYGEKLKDAGVEVRICRFDGNIHGFMQNFPGSPDNMRGYDISSEFLNSDVE